MAVELDGLLPRNHFFNPDDARMILARHVYFLAKLSRNFRRIGSTCAEDDLRICRQIANGIYQMCYALLPCNPAYKQDVRDSGIYAMIKQRLILIRFLIFSQIDSVIDDMDTVRINVGIS